MLDLLIIGAGPTGLTAAAEAARHGLSVRIIDANTHASQHSKALVLHSRSLEVFAAMGLADRLIQHGQEFRALNIYANRKSVARIDFRALDWQDALYPFWLSLPQSETERLLEAHTNALGIMVERQTRLVALEQSADRVRATVERTNASGAVIGHELIEASWLVGCDGARSTTRKLCAIPFEGDAEDALFILGDVQIDWDMAAHEGHTFMADAGILLVVPMPQPGFYRLIAHMPALPSGTEPKITLALLQALMDERTGMATRLHDLRWHSSFSVKHLVADQHRLGRVFLAGDAAHIHSPVGGQGLNTGIQDAYNLIWKLALVHHGKGSPALLDSYAHERHAIAESTIKQVRFATRIVTLKNPLSRRLRNQLGSFLLKTGLIHHRMGRGVGMLDLCYQPSAVIHEELQPGRHTRQLRTGLAKRSNAPQAGMRAPNVSFRQSDATTHTLLPYLYGTSHILLLFQGQQSKQPSETLRQIQALVQQQYSDRITCYLITPNTHIQGMWPGQVIIDDQAASLHRHYSGGIEALYLIRPDQYIGYRSQPVRLESFSEYLHQTLNGQGDSHAILSIGGQSTIT